MKSLSLILRINAGVLITLAMCNAVLAQPVPERSTTPQFQAPKGTNRYTVVISDLHFGLGCDARGVCVPSEDFRWPVALAGFLSEIGKRGMGRTDLVIAGDFLELWQPPERLACSQAAGDLGCTVGEMESIVSVVVTAHRTELELLRRFSQADDNRLVIIPGNHDAALLLPTVWAIVGNELDEARGRISFVSDGVWSSSDGKIVVEHGHQIGNDANKYDYWPQVTGLDATGQRRLRRTWGEDFVRQLYNNEEATYPIVDNLSPETAGIWYRIADRGLGGSSADLARFVSFNLFETSWSQRGAVLGGSSVRSHWGKDDLDRGRALGSRLFTESLEPNDPVRKLLLGEDSQASGVRHELDELARTSSDSDIEMLCQLLANRASSVACRPRDAGAAASSLIPKTFVINRHVEELEKTHHAIQIFIYGHTHKVETPWPVNPRGLRTVTVLNSGAFQRLIDDADYRKLVDDMNVSKSAGLREVSLEQLAACYSAVEVSYAASDPKARTLIWQMAEQDSVGRMNPPPRSCRPNPDRSLGRR